MECILLMSVFDTAPGDAVKDALATLQNLILRFRPFIVQATQGIQNKDLSLYSCCGFCNAHAQMIFPMLLKVFVLLFYKILHFLSYHISHWVLLLGCLTTCLTIEFKLLVDSFTKPIVSIVIISLWKN